tara:strand:- start:872 stop:1093 length:222 start_codon:yes stop_codon:yes gene_type:complete
MIKLKDILNEDKKLGMTVGDTFKMHWFELNSGAPNIVTAKVVRFNPKTITLEILKKVHYTRLTPQEIKTRMVK